MQRCYTLPYTETQTTTAAAAKAIPSHLANPVGVETQKANASAAIAKHNANTSLPCAPSLSVDLLRDRERSSRNSLRLNPFPANSLGGCLKPFIVRIDDQLASPRRNCKPRNSPCHPSRGVFLPSPPQSIFSLIRNTAPTACAAGGCSGATPL